MSLEPDVTKKVQIHGTAPDGTRGILNRFESQNGATSAATNRFEAQRKLIEEAETMASRWQGHLPFHTIKVVLA